MSNMTRRRAVGCLAAAAATAIPRASVAIGLPRMRLVIDNDFAGDPDGLFQLAHHLLSGSVDIPLIVSSHLHPGESWNGSPEPVAGGAAEARGLIDLIKPRRRPVVALGATAALISRTSRPASQATAAIVAEIMREDGVRPSYYTAGAGLTELALAWLAEPRIGSRIRLIWIGGNEHVAATQLQSRSGDPEYNLTIDPLAAQIIFEESDITIWQVPRDTYRQMLTSYAELETLAAQSRVGKYLKARVDKVMSGAAERSGGRGALGETYVLGDSPLVTLTALQSPFEPDPSSSRYIEMPTPRLRKDGTYQPNPAARPMRVYTAIDTRLTFSDMARKFIAAGA